MRYRNAKAGWFWHIALLVVLWSQGSAAFAQQQREGTSKSELAAPLIDKARTEGTVRVVVGLNQAYRPDGELGDAEAVEQRENIQRSQEALMDELQGYDVTPLQSYDYIPYMAIEVGEDALRALVDSGAVATIEEDVLSEPTLSSTIPIVGADDAHGLGFTGSGQTVAILDTGIEGLHSFFGGRIVSEACYSNASPSTTRRSLCPSGSQTQIGPGAAEATTAQCFNGASNLCRHGSHVAGIAAGNGSSFSGVAKSSNIIAIQVFTRFNSSADCSPSAAPCVLSYTSDQIKGLERVYALRSTYNIAAANMSLGGGSYTSQASCDAANASRKAVIDLLRSAKIATVISSGNKGFTNALGAPGCISSAISVGATTDSDTVAGFSNSASFLDMLAPGVGVTSSVPVGGFASFNGTSMAAPHVTGAWALYKQLNPTATVPAVEAALKSSGKPVTDSRNGITKPRLDIGKAITTAGGAPKAIIEQLWPVTGAKVGGSARLWARVKNTGAVALPSDAKVQYWVNGPSWTGSHVVGTRSVAGLAPGASRWYYIDWTIPCGRPPGGYSYWARAIRGTSTALSSWKGPQNFVVASGESALVESLFSVSGANVGGNARLWARVRNNGCSALPADAKVQYWVHGPFWAGSHYVGTTSVAGLAPGAAQWKLLNWSIASSRPAGDYSYWARVIRGTSTGLSPWRGPQDFLVTGPAFDSTFNGSARPWQVHNGTWSIQANRWYYTPGVLGQIASISYPVDFANFDYEATLWRVGSQMTNANRLEVRGVPDPLDPTMRHWRSAYLFQITKSGMYSVWKTNGSTQTPIQTWTASTAIRTGNAWNTLRVRAFGPTMRFYINGVPVWGGTDTTFAAGRVGVGMFAGGGSSANGFWLDNAKLTVLGATSAGNVGEASGAQISNGDVEETLSEGIDASQLELNEAATVGGLVGTIDEAPASPDAVEQATNGAEAQRGPHQQ